MFNLVQHSIKGYSRRSGTIYAGLSSITNRQSQETQLLQRKIILPGTFKLDEPNLMHYFLGRSKPNPFGRAGQDSDCSWAAKCPFGASLGWGDKWKIDQEGCSSTNDRLHGVSNRYAGLMFWSTDSGAFFYAETRARPRDWLLYLYLYFDAASAPVAQRSTCI